jgi:hypothetical protein
LSSHALILERARANYQEEASWRYASQVYRRSWKTGVKATFRAEATNIFNMVSLGQPRAVVVPAAGATSATSGVIRTANPMRRLQLGAQLTF